MDNNVQENNQVEKNEQVTPIETEVVPTEVPVENSVQKDSKNHEANVLTIISLVLFFAGSSILVLITMLVPALEKLTVSLSGMCPLIAIVLLIIARVKCPQNQMAKIVMWLYIVLIVLGIVLFVALMIACANVVRNCPG